MLSHIQKTFSLSHQLRFKNTLLIEKYSHKHLGLTLQSNLKWDEHIASLSSKVNMLISCLKTFKYSLNRKSLETMYKSFILPLFDYADIIWDSCTETQSNILENLHLDAIRTIIGGVRGTSHHKLYEESGFSSLKERRKIHKLVTFKKITLGLCPQYLSNILPPLMSSVNPYHRRNPNQRQIPRCRTETLRKSFFPSTVDLWNSLPEDIQQTSSISAFKRYLAIPITKVPSYYYVGDRKAQIIHCRLRLQTSDLFDDLKLRHLRDDSICTCGDDIETAKHFLLHCSNYSEIRTNTILTLPENWSDINSLLKGNPLLSNAENETIFLCVQNFITQTERFSN